LYSIFKFIIVFIITSTLLEATQIQKLVTNFTPTKKESASGAVILKKNIHVFIDKNGYKQLKNYYLIAILDNQATIDYGQISKSFNSYYQDINLDFARVITSSGKTKEIQPDAVQIQTSKNYNSYNDTKELLFSLPAIQSGSFIEFQISYKTKRQVLKNQNSGYNFLHYLHSNISSNRLRIDPIRESSLKIDISNNKKLFFNTHKIKQPTITKDLNKTTYLWKIFDLPKVKVENSTILPYSEILPRVTYSTLNNWQTLKKMLFVKYDEASNPNEEIKKLAKQITKDCKTDLEKIKKIYTYIQDNIKYIFAYFNSGGIIPHQASTIIENLYGDCKDQTTLFISLLKSINIKAFPSLLNTYPSIIEDNDPPSNIYFNHVIVYVPKEDIWIDTTSYKSVFPGLNWSLNNKKTLILDNTNTPLKKIVFDNLQTINIDVQINTHNDKLSGLITFKPDSYLSSFYKSLISNSQDAKRLIKNDFSKIYPSAKIVEFNFLNIENSSKNIEIRYKFQIDQQEQDIYYFNSILAQVIRLFTQINSLTPPDDRTYGYKFPYKIKIDLKTEFNPLNREYKPTFLKSTSSFDTKYYKYDFFKKNRLNTIITFETLIFKKDNISLKNYSDYYNTSKELFNDINWILEYKKDKYIKKELELKEKLKESFSEEKEMELVQHYLDIADFKRAKDTIVNIIKNNNKNAKAHYMYGIVLGYLDQFDKSETEFKIAKELGFKEIE